MARYGFVIDITRCNACYNCVLACKDEHVGNERSGYFAPQPVTGQFWMRLVEKERGRFPKVKMAYIPVPCMHCENASCIAGAKDGAVYRRDDGIVMIDPEKAKGQRQILSWCPYRVIYWNETLNLPQKCTMCAHLLDAGEKEPRCVEACPLGVLKFGDLDDPTSEVAQLVAARKAEVLHPEYGLLEKVFYIGLPRRFVAGTVYLGSKDECAEDVLVTLQGDGVAWTTRTDNYGDFEFEGLREDENFKVRIEAPGYKPEEFAVRTTTDVYLGDVVLTR